MPEPVTPQTEEQSDARRVATGMLAATVLTGSLVGMGDREVEVSRPVPVVVEHHTTIEELPANPEDLVITVPARADNEYREDFETTASDAESSEEQVVRQLKELLGEDGWGQVYDIQVTGSASAEDESNDEAGVQSESAENSNLALQRALLAAKPVIEQFAEHGIDVKAPVQKAEGEDPEPMLAVEGVEDSWSDADLASANELAQQHGYQTVEEMVERYNDGEASPAVSEFLDPLLKDERGATIVLKMRDGEEKKVTTVKTVDVVGERDVTETHTEDEKFVNPTIGVLPAQHAVELKPWEVKARRRDMFREQKGAPQGNGARPIRHRGRTHATNPTPSNFSR